jgi:polyhydroxyalkanoate synthesis regulator phasin
MSDLVVTAPAAVGSDDRSYVDWPAIIAGSVVASAISLVLLTFGSAVGLSLTSAFEGSGISFTALAIAAGLWLLWVQVSGFFAGGYLTGRMRRRHFDATEEESDIRDGSHGLAVWGVGVLIGALIAFSGVSAAVSTATTAASNAAAGVAAAAVGSADDLADRGQLVVDRLLRAGNASPQNADVADQRSEVSRILVSSVASGTLEAADRQYLVDTVAARAGIPPEEAQQRVDQLYAQAQELEAQARAAADRARKIAVVTAFMTAASLLIGGVGAYFGAVLGGNHRDKRTVVEGWVRPW